MPKYYEISEAAAKRAKDMNSYSDYAPGSATAGYRAMVDEAYALAEKQKAQVDPMYHDKIDALVDRYARRLAENLNERNAIDARVPSILITGGGNFPVAKKAKQNAARDRNYGEYAEIEKLLDKIRSTGRGGISADDDLAVEKLTKKLEGMESQQAMMKAVNAYYRKHKTLEGCPELTAEQVEKVKASMSQDWRKDPVPFPSYLLTNNNANIRRVRQRIEELSHKAEFVGWTFPGGEAKVNEAENRLQLIFEDKPDADTRQALKSEGFKWAPSQGAWQRQLNQNAIRAAARLDFLRPEDGKSPYQVVLANIQRLLDAGVAVLIRLNMDEHNADNLMELADELHERFGENKKLTVYSHVLYEFLGCKESIPADSRNELYQKQQALYHKLVTLGYVKKLGLRKDLPLRRCIADHGGALTILPNGELGLCEQYSENNFIGHIDSEKLDETVRQSFRESWPALDACRKCFFYPECIRLKKCIEQQKCYEQMQIKVREDTLSAMRNTYEAWLKKEQIREEEPHSDC